MINPVLSLYLERSETVQKLMNENPELADHVELLERVIHDKAEASEQWREEAERRAKSIKDLQAELSYYIQKNPNQKRDWNNLQKYKVMSQWFDEYVADNKKKGGAYKLVYDRAVKADLISVRSTKKLTVGNGALGKH